MDYVKNYAIEEQNMDKGTCVAFVLFHIFRHYKRVEVSTNRRELISDIKKSQLLLKHMEDNIDPSVSEDIVLSLINSINSFGNDIKIQYPIRYVDNYDRDIISAMIKITDEIIALARSPFYRRYLGEIYTRFLVLHNLPRVLLDNSSGDLSTVKNFHISKKEAIECVSIYLGQDWFQEDGS